MAIRTGAATRAALKLNAASSPAWGGTAGSVSTGDACQATFTPSMSVSPLTSSPIGTGNQMDTDTIHGQLEYGFNLAGEATFQSGLDRLLAQFFGTSGAPVEQTTDEDDYLHTMTMNSTWNANNLTYGIETSSSTTLEFATCAVTSLTLSSSSTKSFLNWQASLIANAVTTSSPQNNNAALAAATIADSEKIVVSPSDTFWINTSGGDALDSGDLVAITDYSITINKPQETAKEVKGAAGNGAPVATGQVDGTITITLRSNADNAYFSGWDAETEYKCLFTSSGTQIGAGDNKAINIYVPKMKLIDFPGYSVTDPGTNPLTLTFKILGASANPTGMSSTLPYVSLLNGRSTAYIS